MYIISLPTTSSSEEIFTNHAPIVAELNEKYGTDLDVMFEKAWIYDIVANENKIDIPKNANEIVKKVMAGEMEKPAFMYELEETSCNQFWWSDFPESLLVVESPNEKEKLLKTILDSISILYKYVEYNELEARISFAYTIPHIKEYLKTYHNSNPTVKLKEWGIENDNKLIIENGTKEDEEFIQIINMVRDCIKVRRIG